MNIVQYFLDHVKVTTTNNNESETKFPSITFTPKKCFIIMKLMILDTAYHIGFIKLAKLFFLDFFTMLTKCAVGKKNLIAAMLL